MSQVVFVACPEFNSPKHFPSQVFECNAIEEKMRLTLHLATAADAALSVLEILISMSSCFDVEVVGTAP